MSRKPTICTDHQCDLRTRCGRYNQPGADRGIKHATKPNGHHCCNHLITTQAFKNLLKKL